MDFAASEPLKKTPKKIGDETAVVFRVQYGNTTGLLSLLAEAQLRPVGEPASNDSGLAALDGEVLPGSVRSNVWIVPDSYPRRQVRVRRPVRHNTRSNSQMRVK